MAADKIRIGVIGANIHRGWAPRSHRPALVASLEFDLTAVWRRFTSLPTPGPEAAFAWKSTVTRVPW
jgi:hypothetical protein